MNHIALVLTSYPARIKFVPKVIEAWMQSKEQPDEKVLYLSLNQYPNRDKDIPYDVLDELRHLDVKIIYRDGDERNFKSYYAGSNFPDWWLLQVDDDYLPSKGSFDRFYELHKQYPKNFISCLDTSVIIGNGVLYNASMLDKRYIDDMHKVIPLFFPDLWLGFWTCYSNIDVTPMNPPLDRVQIEEANETYLG